MKIELTKLQLWFVKLAVHHQNDILPLSEKALNSKLFEEDYGVSKEEVLKELQQLENKLKKVKS